MPVYAFLRKVEFSLPHLPTVCSALAVRNVFALASDEEYTGRRLLEYFLGTDRGLFFDGERVGPSAKQPQSFYAYVLRSLRSLRSQLPDLDFALVQPSKVSEILAVATLTPEQRAVSETVRWNQLTATTLPADVRDFGWLRGWGVLPTKDRLAAWGVAPSDRCPQCGQRETLQHAMFDCRVVKTFWTLLSRMFGHPLNARTKSRDAFVTFLLAVGCDCMEAARSGFA